jgi:hypothetical protein
MVKAKNDGRKKNSQRQVVERTIGYTNAVGFCKDNKLE